MNPVALYFMARNAARDLVQHATPLNDGIAKHASEQGLSQLQIQRVVEAANHEANALLTKQAEQNTFTFDLASLDGVLAALTAGAAGHTVSFLKVAEALDPVLILQDDFMTRLDALPTQSAEQVAADLRGAAIQLDKVAARADKQGREMQASRYSRLTKCGESMDLLISRSREYIQRGGELIDLQKVAHEVDPTFINGWDTLFGRVQEEIRKLGHAYDGELASRTDLIADRADRPGGALNVRAKVQVLNGQHTICGELRQLRDHVTFLERLGDRTRDIDNFATSVRVAQMMINSNEDVDTSICKEAQVLFDLKDDELAGYIAGVSKIAGDDKKRPSDARTAIRGAIGAAIDHTGKQSIKAVIKRGTNDWVPGAFTGPGTPAAYKGS